MPRTRQYASLLIVMSLAFSGVALAQTPPRGVRFIPTIADRLGVGPSHLFWLREGISGVVDTIENSVVFIDDAGHVIAASPLPTGFMVGHVIGLDDRIVIDSGDGRTQINLARSVNVNGLALVARRKFLSLATTAARVGRSGDGQLTIQLPQSGRGARATQLAARAITNGFLADVSEVGGDANSQQYLRWSELVSTTPTIEVRSFVGRYAPDGQLNAIAEVPIADMAYIPAGYATVTGGGELRVLVPTQETVEIRTLPFLAIAPVDQRIRKADVSSEFLRQLQGNKGTIIRVDTIVGPSRQGQVKPALAPAAPGQPVTRDEVMKAAQEFTTVRWVLSAKNFAHSGVPSECDPPGRTWQRPYKFTQSMVGKEQVGTPYNWGGDDTAAVLVKRMGEGALAGNICTCRDGDCVVEAAAGLDCSGLVSRAWKLVRHFGTSELPDIAPPVAHPGPRLENAMRGDIFNRESHHVRLFKSANSAGNLKIVVLESITARTCQGPKTVVTAEGVAECVRTIDEFNNFKLLRYKSIRE